MEIYVQLAGMTLGPYSAEYVRRSLQEGHLKSSDQARLSESDNWTTVDQVLAQLSPGGAKPSSAPASPAKQASPPPAPSAPSIPASKSVAPKSSTASSSPTTSPTVPKEAETPKSKLPVAPPPPPGSSKPGATSMPAITYDKTSTPPQPVASPKPPKTTTTTNRVFSPKIIGEAKAPSPTPVPSIRKSDAIPQKASSASSSGKAIPRPVIVATPSSSREDHSGKTRSKKMVQWGIYAVIGLALLIVGYLGFSYGTSSSTTKSSEEQSSSESSDTAAPEKKVTSTASSSLTKPVTPTAAPTPTSAPTPVPSPAKETNTDQTTSSTTPPANVTNQTVTAPSPAPVSASPPPPAIAISPSLYVSQGDAKLAKGDFDGAIENYSKALEIDPKLTDALCNRGIAKQSKGDLDGAVSDYSKAIVADPKSATAYHDHGLVLQLKSDWNGAISDYTQALTFDTKDVQDYYNRGQAKQGKGDLDGALGDLKQYCHLSPATDFYSHYAHLYIWVISARQKHLKEADQDLSAALASGWNDPADDMASKIAQFLLGKIHEPELISTANVLDPKQSQQKYCEIWYFAGMKRLLAGDQETAMDYLRKCLATEQKSYSEYILAQAQLKTLEAVSAKEH